MGVEEEGTVGLVWAGRLTLQLILPPTYTQIHDCERCMCARVAFCFRICVWTAAHMGGHAMRDLKVALSKQISTTGVPSDANSRLPSPAPCGATTTAARRHAEMSSEMS